MTAAKGRIQMIDSTIVHSRRIATRYDKTSESFLSFALIGAIRLWIRYFVNAT